jgi:nucleoside-diphosphate-sugar epimerase
MNALIIGATGYVGSAIDEAMTARGHRTVGTARSEIARAKLQARGTAVVPGDAAKPQTLIAAVKAADAVVYCVQATDADSMAVDLDAVRTIARAMAGSERTFVYLSSTWIYGDTTGIADENAEVRPPAYVSKRADLDRMTLNMVKIGIRGHVVRSGIVYGDGGGVPAMFVHSARARSASTIVGEGRNHWAAIGREDLGRLVSLVIERGKPGQAYNAVDDYAYTVREIAEAASRGAGAQGRTTVVDPDILGPFGDCLVLDQRVSALRAKRELGWNPSPTSIVDELERGSYLAAQIA